MISKLQYISQGETPEVHLENIQRACTFGVDWVQLRLKDFDDKLIFDTAKKAKEITDYFQARLIINDHYKIAAKIKADGVHLGKNDSCSTIARKELASWQIIGGTANTVEDCKKLMKERVDYIGLGPFQFTDTKKNLSPVLGKKGYLTIIKALKTTIPIIAVGGITIDDIDIIISTGVYGVAVSKAITDDFNNISKFNKIIKGSSTNEQIWKIPQQKVK